MASQYKWKSWMVLIMSISLILTCFTGCTQLQSVWRGIMKSISGNVADYEIYEHPELSETDTIIQRDPNIPDQTIIPAKPVDLDHGADDQDEAVQEPDNPDAPGESDNPDISGQTDPDDPSGSETYGTLAAGERVEDSYFDDAVFIGDSVSVMLQYYTMAMRADDPDFLGKAQFLTAGSFGYRHAVSAVSDSSIHPTYNGQEMLLEDAIAQMGAKKIYIMLGMNDISNGNYTRTLENVTTLVSRILEQSPDAKFYFQSVTPRMENSETSYLNNDIISTFNTKLAAYCEENHYYFVNVYEGVCDENGDLPAAYCGDPVSEGGKGMGIHFTYAGCAAWVDYLYTHTA